MFWRLTPREFSLLVEGKQRAYDREMRLLAWHSCNIINVWLPKGRRVKVADLMGDKEALPPLLDKDSLRQYMRERIAGGKQRG